MADASKPTKPNFSARDLELLAYAMKCVLGNVMIDVDKFAKLAGYKTKASANTAWWRLKAEFGLANPNGQDASSSVASKKKAAGEGLLSTNKAEGSGKKRKATDQTDDIDPLDAAPKKVQKKGRKTKADDPPNLAANMEGKALGNTTPSDKIKDGEVASEVVNGSVRINAAQDKGEDGGTIPPVAAKGNAAKKRGGGKGKASA